LFLTRYVTTTGTDERLWVRLERYLRAGMLIPVLGPGCITFGEDDVPLYPWLAQQLVERLGIELPASFQRPLDLHAVACAHIAARGSVEDLSMELDILLDCAELKPSRLLCDLARIGAFTHFLTLGFDPLLECALSEVRYGGLQKPRVWSFSLGQPPEDLPFGTKNAPQTLIGYLFGRVSPNPSFHIWDHDAIEFVWSLQRALPSLNTLATTLASNNLLILGTDFADWLERFFLRVIKNKPLREDPGLPFLLAERRVRAEAEAVLFYDALGGRIEIVHNSPLDFAREFVARALRGFALPSQMGRVPLPPPVDRDIPCGAIFLSYCHADRVLTFRVAEKLQRHGCLVWLDRDRLAAGDHFENHLEDAVKKHCSLFLSLITPTTERRVESYFHRERRWAAERAQHFAPNEPFYIPFASEDAPLEPQREPREFATIHVERTQREDPATPESENISDALCERLHILQQARLPVKGAAA
jgi:hypothetical protein